MVKGESPLNSFCVDLEEWFHICGVSKPYDDPSTWDAARSLVERRACQRNVIEPRGEARERVLEHCHENAVLVTKVVLRCPPDLA